jgi:glycine betaine/proline transport system substrate-binding protein
MGGASAVPPPTQAKNEGGRMSNRRARPVRLALAALALVVVGALGVSASAFGRSDASSCGSLTIDENAWAGATANVYVLKYVLEKNLGCTVNIAKLPESTPLFQAMADGKVDVLLEDWGNIQLKVNQKYVKSGALVNLGSNGVIGHIGWFVPTYLMKQYPQLKTWQGLKGKESIFKSPESGSQGMFLGGDPSYVQKDAQLIKELGLNLKFVSVGAEPAQVARWTQAYKQKKPILFYWYTPQYLNTAYQLSEIKLPARSKKCVDSYNPKLGSNWSIYKCAYGLTIIEKVITSKFAKSGSPAVGVVKRWKWTADDQNYVANLIAGKHMDPAKAAEQWVKANPAKVKAWLGK